ncbi:MAG: hypothetical protein IAF58_05815, partial [Leptolyngbya sp.]|nr:hypothetical protein [Candidatus Melainabacteria bacterium]
MTGKHSIQGGWRGRYFYTGDNSPHGFEAVFIDMNGVLEGNILDDGRLGEAIVGGNFSYPLVKFTKLYHAEGSLKVTYQGTMSDDGKTMQGRWTIDGANSGTWSAARFDDGEDLT